MNYKVIPLFQGKAITIPLVHPVVLMGAKEDKNFMFKFSYEGSHYYIFVTLQQGVINNNLPNSLEHSFKDLLIESVNQYCDRSRQGLTDNIFASSLKGKQKCLQSNTAD